MTAEGTVSREQQGLEAAEKVYTALLAQGRPEAAARRDAERWVAGNLGVEVKLPDPLSEGLLPDEEHGLCPGPAGPRTTVTTAGGRIDVTYHGFSGHVTFTTSFPF